MNPRTLEPPYEIRRPQLNRKRLTSRSSCGRLRRGGVGGASSQGEGAADQGGGRTADPQVVVDLFDVHHPRLWSRVRCRAR